MKTKRIVQSVLMAALVGGTISASLFMCTPKDRSSANQSNSNINIAKRLHEEHLFEAESFNQDQEMLTIALDIFSFTNISQHSIVHKILRSCDALMHLENTIRDLVVIPEVQDLDTAEGCVVFAMHHLKRLNSRSDVIKCNLKLQRAIARLEESMMGTLQRINSLVLAAI